MQANEFIFNSVKRAAIEKGCDEFIATDEANLERDKYLKGDYTQKPSHLIEKSVKSAVKKMKLLKKKLKKHSKAGKS